MKRATSYCGNAEENNQHFNPRPHEEGDPYDTYTTTYLCNFNPRPHEEGDKKISRRPWLYYNFNPRPHEEGDFLSPLR